MDDIYTLILAFGAVLALIWAVVSIIIDDAQARRNTRNTEQLQQTLEYLIGLYNQTQDAIRQNSTIQRNYAREIVELKCRIIQLEKKLDCKN